MGGGEVGFSAPAGTIAFPNLPTLGGVSKNCSFAVGYNEICIASGSTCYAVDYATNTVTAIGAPLPDCSSVAYIDGRYVWVATAGDLVYYSDVNDPLTTQALSFFDAESRPDLNREVAVIGNDLFVFGTKSIERFRGSGISTAPFTRVNNSVISIGYVGAITKLSDKIIFIGRPVGGGLGIYELTLGSVTKISNFLVDEILNDKVEQINIQETVGMSFDSYGRTIYAFTTMDQVNYSPGFGSGSNDDRGFLGLYCVPSEQYSWGFISDNPNNDMTGFSDWYKYPIGFESNLVSDNVYFARAFTFKHAVLWRDSSFREPKWMFQRTYGFDVLTTPNYSMRLCYIERGGSTSDLGSEPISSGFRSYAKNTSGKPISLSGVEVFAFVNEDGQTNTGTIGLSVSRTGRVDTSTVPMGLEWSAIKAQSMNGRDDNFRYKILPSGGAVTNDTYISFAVEVNGGYCSIESVNND